MLSIKLGSSFKKRSREFFNVSNFFFVIFINVCFFKKSVFIRFFSSHLPLLAADEARAHLPI